jgi:hypothetical protein
MSEDSQSSSPLGSPPPLDNEAPFDGAFSFERAHAGEAAHAAHPEHEDAVLEAVLCGDRKLVVHLVEMAGTPVSDEACAASEHVNGLDDPITRLLYLNATRPEPAADVTVWSRSSGASGGSAGGAGGAGSVFDEPEEHWIIIEEGLTRLLEKIPDVPSAPIAADAAEATAAVAAAACSTTAAAARAAAAAAATRSTTAAAARAAAAATARAAAAAAPPACWYCRGLMPSIGGCVYCRATA